VLDAVRKSPESKMYFFGITALDRFKTRLKDYPQYCQHVSCITHFKVRLVLRPRICKRRAEVTGICRATAVTGTRELGARFRLGSVVGPVFQATGRSEFEDGLGSGDFCVGLLISHDCPH
jgi:hypothetical protein